MLSLTDTGAGRRIWGSSVKIAKRFILVIQPETQQMWEEKVWAGWLIATSPAQYLNLRAYLNYVSVMERAVPEQSVQELFCHYNQILSLPKQCDMRDSVLLAVSLLLSVQGSFQAPEYVRWTLHNCRY